MFDPTIGRWTTEDPIGFVVADANLYRYVGNNPTNATDPSGLREVGFRFLSYSTSATSRKAQVKVQWGVFTWNITVPDVKGKSIEAHFTFKPDPGNKAEAISFLQVIHERTLGGKPYYAGTDEYFQKFSTDPTKANYLDHYEGEDDPYYGAKWDGSKWIDEGRAGTVGGARGTKTATMNDWPSFDTDGRKGKVAIARFETAAFCIDSQEVLAVLTWGFKVPANKGDPIELFGGFAKDFSLEASGEFKKLIQKANGVASMKHKVTAPNRSKIDCGGTSALPP